MDSRFRGNDKEEKEKQKKKNRKKNMGKMPTLHMGETPMLRKNTASSRVIPAKAGIHVFSLFVIPAKAGIHVFSFFVIPAKAGIQFFCFCFKKNPCNLL